MGTGEQRQPPYYCFILWTSGKEGIKQKFKYVFHAFRDAVRYGELSGFVGLCPMVQLVATVVMRPVQAACMRHWVDVMPSKWRRFARFTWFKLFNVYRW